jgi:hypothetical protein
MNFVVSSQNKPKSLKKTLIPSGALCWALLYGSLLPPLRESVVTHMSQMRSPRPREVQDLCRITLLRVDLL